MGDQDCRWLPLSILIGGGERGGRNWAVQAALKMVLASKKNLPGAASQEGFEQCHCSLIVCKFDCV